MPEAVDLGGMDGTVAVFAVVPVVLVVVVLPGVREDMLN